MEAARDTAAWVPAMDEEGSSASGSSEEAVVQLENAVEQLVEHLVVPALPCGQVDREVALSPETQEAVARQVHATVLLYNYYHRKQFPELEFASPDRFCMSASRTISNKNLLMYLNQAQNHIGDGVGAELSVTDKAIIDACGIAEALDPTKDSPDMIMWPISKVAVMLLHRTKKTCLIERGSETKGVWSIFEKDFKTASVGGSLSSDVFVPGPSQSMALSSEPYMLQQTAYSEVEHKTGMKRTDLRFIEEHRVYSLSQKGTTTMLFLLDYDQAVDSELREMPLDDLIQRMSGPIFKSGLYPITTSVVDFYSLLPYKEVLINIMNRDWPLGSSLSAPKEQVVKAVGDSGTNNFCTSKNRIYSNRNRKRKSEAFETKVATYAEHGDGQSPTKDSQPSVPQDIIPTPDVDPAIDEHALKSQKENVIEKSGVPQDIIPTPDVNPLIDDHALESQIEKAIDKSGGIVGNIVVQKYATLQLLRKMLYDTRRENFVLGDRTAEYQMDIQTMLTETEMTHKVTSILKKYENSWKMEIGNPISSGEGCQNKNIKRKKLKEAILLRNRCQELDDICREGNWVLPRYTVFPSVTDDMYQASVYLTGPDFNFNANGDMKVTPHEARDSAASKMLSLLQQKAKED